MLFRSAFFAAALFAQLGGPINVPITITNLPLPRHLGVGLLNGPTQLAWMSTTTSPTPWDYRYTYVTPGWPTFNSPSGQFAVNYAQDSYNNGFIPVFSVDEVGGAAWGNPAGGLFSSSGLQSTSNMSAYYTDFVLLLTKIQQFLNGSFDNNRLNGSLSVSNSNLTVTQTGGGGADQVSFGVTSHASGKWSMKFTSVVKGGNESVGLATANAANNLYLGSNTNSISWTNAGPVYFNGAPVTTIQTFAQGDVLWMAVDLTNKLVWFRDGAGNWNNSGSANPDTGVGGISISSLASTTLFPAVDTVTVNDSFVADFLSASGLTTFTPWSDPSGRPGPPIIHVEPDLEGFMQQQGCSGGICTSASGVAVSVASSGYSGLGGFANTGAGFYQALLSLRTTYAPSVIAAENLSLWGPNNGYYPNDTVSPTATADSVAAFYKTEGAGYDLLFHDPSDADAGYKVVVRGNSASISPTTCNSTTCAWWVDPGSFTSYQQYLNEIYVDTGLRGMIWQMPVGNYVYLTDDNVSFHYQDNQVQYYLNPASGYANAQQFVNAGIIGLLFGSGQSTSSPATTDYYDQAADGITNPAVCPSCNPFSVSNSTTSTVSDDDGGLLRNDAAAYYTAGALSW